MGSAPMYRISLTVNYSAFLSGLRVSALKSYHLILDRGAGK